MANIRAYKLAEELGIDRAAIVDRAAEVGIELKSPMAAVDDETAALLREKLGKVIEPTSVVTERRVQQSGGSAVIRRRKKAATLECDDPFKTSNTKPQTPVTIAARQPKATSPCVRNLPRSTLTGRSTSSTRSCTTTTQPVFRSAASPRPSMRTGSIAASQEPAC